MNLHAEVVLEEVHAESVVLAGIGVAEADVLLAPVSGPALGAGATVTCHLVPAGPAVEAGRAGAVVHVGLAELTL